VAGQTTLPLPLREMQAYPPGPATSPPQSDLYRSYLDHYQTRFMTKAFWNRVRHRAE
jgi:hypothetical protein